MMLKYSLLSKDQFFLVLMNDFQIKLIKELDNFNEKVITMDATFDLNDKKLSFNHTSIN